MPRNGGQQEALHSLGPGGLGRLLAELSLLLGHVQRLPDTRLARFFVRPAGGAGQARDTAPVPPTWNQAYFLDRIAAIAAVGAGARADGHTDPSVIPAGMDQADPGPQLNDLAFLLWARDFLAAVTSPASVETIRVTRAFRMNRLSWKVLVPLLPVSWRYPPPPPEYATDHERALWQFGARLAARTAWYHFFTILFILLSVWSSFLVFSGQVLIRENEALQAAHKDLRTRIALAEKDDRRELGTLLVNPGRPSRSLPTDYCELVVPPVDPPAGAAPAKQEVRTAPGAPPARRPPGGTMVQPVPLPIASKQIPPGSAASSAAPATAAQRLYLLPQQRQLCDERKALDRREFQLKQMHALWVMTLQPLAFVVMAVPALPFGPPPPLLDEAPERSPPGAGRVGAVAASAPSAAAEREQRFVVIRDLELATHRMGMEQMVNGLIGAILPVTYACLGALAFLFRRISRKVESETLSAADYGGMRTSLVLGILTGAVIGLFSNFLGSGSQHAGIPLSTTALALLAGFASDRVFVMLDTIAERVFGSPNAERKATPSEVVQ